MTANEMKANLLVTYDAVYSQSAPGFEDNELSILLSKAQLLYVLKTLNPKLNVVNEVFEETEMKSQGLSALIKDGLEAIDPPTISNNQVGSKPTGVFWELPDNLMYVINEEALTNIHDCSKLPNTVYKRIPVSPISHGEYNKFINNPYRKPYCDGYDGLVLRLKHANKNNKKIHELLTDGNFNVTQYYIRYIKEPVDIVIDTDTPINQVDCELDSFVHNAIIDLGIKLLDKAIRESIPISQLSIDDYI
jgi:hypothetical protein